MRNKILSILSALTIIIMCLASCDAQKKTTESQQPIETVQNTENVKIPPLPWKYSDYYVLLDQGTHTGNLSSFERFDNIEPFFSNTEDYFSIPKEINITFGGYELYGSLFTASFDSPSAITPVFGYKVTIGNESGITKFYIDESKRIVAVYTDKTVIDSSFEYSKESVLSVHELKDLADTFVKNNFGDYTNLYDFKLISVTDDYYGTDSPQWEHRCTYTYAKFINGIETAESIFLEFNKNGILTHYESNLLGRVEAEVDMSKVDMNKVKDKLNKAIDTVYEGRDGYARINNKILFLGIYILDDGSLGAYYHVKVNLKPENADKQTEEHYVLVNIIPDV